MRTARSLTFLSPLSVFTLSFVLLLSIAAAGVCSGSPQAGSPIPGTGLLRVQSSPAVLTTISVNGIPLGDYDLPWPQFPAGEYKVSFTDVPGFNSPTHYNVTFYGLTNGSELISTESPVPVYVNTTTVVTISFSNATPSYSAYAIFVVAVVAMLSLATLSLSHERSPRRPRTTMGTKMQFLFLVIPPLEMAFLFVILALNAPVKSLQPLPGCLMQPDCLNYASQSSYTLYQAYAELAEGFVLATVFSLAIVLLRPYSGGLDRPLAPSFPRWLVVTIAAFGVSIFGFLVLVEATFSFAPLGHDLGNILYDTIGPSYGAAGFAAWCLTIFTVSLRLGFLKAARVVGLPTILFLMAALLVFDPWLMVWHVTNFAAWQRAGFYLVSNWSVLVVGLTLAALSYASLKP